MIHRLRCVRVSTTVFSCICRCATCAVSVVSEITVTGRLIGAVAPIYLACWMSLHDCLFGTQVRSRSRVTYTGWGLGVDTVQTVHARISVPLCYGSGKWALPCSRRRHQKETDQPTTALMVPTSRHLIISDRTLSLHCVLGGILCHPVSETHPSITRLKTNLY